MKFAWLENVHERVLGAGIPLHFKQYGTPQNNPAIRALMAGGLSVTRAWSEAVTRSLESRACGPPAAGEYEVGCTEIPLMMNDANSPLPTLEATQLLARAALGRALVA
jgi:aspartate/glutamate racemase